MRGGAVCAQVLGVAIIRAIETAETDACISRLEIQPRKMRIARANRSQWINGRIFLDEKV